MRLFCTLLLAALLCACSDPITRANYEHLDNGMPQEQVIALLGEPDQTKTMGIGELTGTTAIWVGRTQRITVVFANHKVLLKTIAPTGEKAPSGAARE
ncbi:MAG: DUF3862 domain-containing protein [Salinisphaera sp.]|nr:DUF3862 domain-containing protein [Salinisphaera sp.]MDN5938370.1 DUF3862 domain-containing protein [Salinisphaera sp.]